MECFVYCYKDRAGTRLESDARYYTEGYEGSPPQRFPTKRSAVCFLREAGCRFDNNDPDPPVYASRDNGRFYELDVVSVPQGEED